MDQIHAMYVRRVRVSILRPHLRCVAAVIRCEDNATPSVFAGSGRTKVAARPLKVAITVRAKSGARWAPPGGPASARRTHREPGFPLTVGSEKHTTVIQFNRD